MTLQQLQRATLKSQRLTQVSPFGNGKIAVLNALEHLGYIQIDTLSIVERAHHHTLWTRIPDYKPGYLEELVSERKVFEYWFHAASYLPMKDFRYALPQMLDVKRNKSHYYNADPKVMRYVMDTIRWEGPKKSRDFESISKKPGNWWSWKPTKLALERLFMQGDLMICGRSGMQKTYDISERVLPDNIDTTEPTPMEFAEYLAKTYLLAYGFTTLKQITHLRKGELLKKNVTEVLNSMLQQGTVQQVPIEGMPSVFVQSDLVDKIYRKPTPSVRLLSPFDNSIIHRDRIKQLFGFDFRLECYTPREKRQYGYFCLPILFGDTFIGRVDCKTHRKEKQLELIHLHIENTTIDIEAWLAPFIAAVNSFADFNNCHYLTLTKVSPSTLTNTLKQAFPKF
ncbi:winged helix-turn-helix domain-containing protein [Algoriphagus sp. Y33]|uniref:winged helix-turn-helix domain-containing protein n=1 Tax=Algoriphagus sp. Y33 TaxID=2772483 RepID=UPI001CE0F1D8|nr:crosslink repair DNA glycosylase YcaQ family protein [Algoriphagus sp. Y33]